MVQWLTLVHVWYFLFLHYTEHFHRVPPPPDWFRCPFVAFASALVALRVWAYLATVRRRGDQDVASASSARARRRLRGLLGARAPSPAALHEQHVA